MPTDDYSLDGWLDVVRLSSSVVTDPDDMRPQVDAIIVGLAAHSGLTLDPVTLRAMAFGIAATQAVQITLSPIPPDDPRFGAATIDSLGSVADFVVRRLDEEI